MNKKLSVVTVQPIIKKGSISLFLFLIMSINNTSLQAQNFNEIIKAVASDRANDDQFGFSVAISGNYAIVGAPFEDENTIGANTIFKAGSVYIFKKDEGGVDNWGEVKKIVASDRNSNDFFGWSVAIFGDYAIVGAFQEDEDVTGINNLSNAGSAYIFKKDEGGVDNWGEVKKIVASDRNSNDFFGWSVAISGDYAIVGAFQEDEDTTGQNNFFNAGSVYIFKKDEGGIDNWGEVKKIVASDRNINDQFGVSVAISDDYAIVGAYQEDEDATGQNNSLDAGSAYIFKKDEGGVDNWGEVKKIVASDRNSDDFFGWRVAISDNYAIVGAYQEDEDAANANTLSNAGSAYIFKKDEGGIDNWGEVKKIVASDRNSDDLFGSSLAISGDYAIVGAYQEDEDATNANTLLNAGSAYIFKKDKGGTDNWGEVKKLVTSDRYEADYFGESIAISGDYIIAGASSDDEDPTNMNTMISAGSVYIFKNSVFVNVNYEVSNIELVIYPNPVQNNLTVQGIKKAAQLLIYNTLGQIVHQINTNDETQIYINIRDLPQGIYTLQVVQVNGQIIAKEFVVF